MPHQPRQTNLPRWARILLSTAALLTLLFLVLLIPEPRPVIPPGAGKPQFVWNQDQFWSQLERRFREARATQPEILARPINNTVATLISLLDQLSQTQALPQDPLFSSIETNLFQLAPLVATSPDHLSGYIALLNRVRQEVKRQSIRWDLNSTRSRATLYRLLFGTRLALEEIMLQLAPAKPIQDLIVCDEEPSSTPSTTVLGLTLHSGDILVSRGGAPTSALISRGNDYPGSFSHVALLHVDENSGRPSVIESHIECGVTVSSLDKYLEDKKLRIMVLRLRSDLPGLITDPKLPHKAAAIALQEARSRHIPYDFAMDSRDHRSRFCSEVVSAGYESVGVNLWTGPTFISSPTVTAWLASVGVRHFETQEPADLEYDPQLRVIAEWRDPATLFKAHADDAVIDAMLAEAKPGECLDYDVAMLPFARVSKAYSAALNAGGKVGPIPEGMSATTALRISKYRRAHAVITAHLLVLADGFKKQNGYPPPYWELVRLAHEAKHQEEPSRLDRDSRR